MTAKTRNVLKSSKFIRLSGELLKNWKLKPYQFCILSSDTKTSNFRLIVIPSARKKIEQINFCCPLLFPNWTENLNYVPQNWGTSKIFEKLKMQPKIVILNRSKISAVQGCCRGNQRYSALNQHCFRHFKVMNSAETNLKYSESELISTECLWDVNPGL